MKVELQQHHHHQSTQQRHLANKNGDLPLDITSLEYHHTDDQKLQATTDTNANKQLTPSPRQPMPVDLLEPCADRHSRSDEPPRPASGPASTSGAQQHDPDIVRQRDGAPDGMPAASVAYRMDISPEESAVLLQPLTEAALLRRSGVDLMADIPMIDDDEETDVVVSEPTAVRSAGALESATEGVVAASEKTGAAPIRTPLKSALRKGGRLATKKGMRVCFQNSSVYYIDTEAEANAAPQLLMVQSLDLPLVTATAAAAADIRQFRAGSTGGQGGQAAAAGSSLDKRYTYEDAIVSLQHFSDVLGPGQYASIADKVRLGAADEDGDSSGEAEIEDDDDGGDSPERIEHPAVAAVADAAPEKVPAAPEVGATSETTSEGETVGSGIVTSGGGKGGEDGDEPVQSLTVANLRQHEMLMEERDVEPEAPAPSCGGASVTERVEVAVTPTSSSAAEKSCAGDGKTNLSPPLKELTVDVLTVASSGAGAGGGGANWQVELSPLNSIPESETDSSSHSSQDTIIMMTTAEAQRNEEHIRHSLAVSGHQQQLNGDAASTVSSQDSDDTVKCEEEEQQQQQEGGGGGGSGGREEAGSGNARACTSSQIREIMERNAQRRSLQRYSNTQKKRTGAGGETPGASSSSFSSSAAPAPTDRQQQQQQRTWKSQESLLDTIKLLTVDDEGDEVEVSVAAAERRVLPHPRLLDARSNDGSNLSLQDVRGLIAAVPPHAARLQQSRRTSSEVSVPGDIRQWKMQANLWADVRRQQKQQQQQQQQESSTAAAAAINDEARVRTELPANEDRAGSDVTLQQHQHHQSGVAQLPASAVSEEEDHYGYYGAGGYVDDGGDELARFVQNDSDRLERLRKRYSYTDGEETYGDVGFGSRRPSVRGIKPRFGSTSEILKQMQGLLHTPSSAAMNGHLTWPYPEAAAATHNPQRHRHHHHNHSHRPQQQQQQQRHSTAVADAWMSSVGNYATLPTSFSGSDHPMAAGRLSYVTSRSAASLPTLTEEIYGTRPTNAVHGRGGHQDASAPVVRTVRGRDGTFIQVYSAAPAQPPLPPAPPAVPHHPPPYQPPPPPPSAPTVHQFQPPPYDHPNHHHRQFDPRQQHPMQPPANHHHQQQQQNLPHYTAPDRMPLLVVAGPPSARCLASKDERGVPEGASSSPKVTLDSLYAHVTAPVERGGPIDVSDGRRSAPGSSSGTVYYAMQV